MSIHRGFRRAVLGALLLATPLGAAQVTLQASKDNSLCEDAAGALSNGAGIHLFSGRTDNGELRRALVAFDLTGQIPAGSTINSAVLTLFMSKTVAGAQPMGLHVVLADWGEGTSNAPMQEGRCTQATPGDATWLHGRFNTVNWSSPGGDYDPAAAATTSVTGPGSYSWGSTPAMVAAVQGWLASPATNHGWILIGNEAISRTAKRFASRENMTLLNRPVLVVDFTPPGAAPDVYESTSEQGIVSPGNLVGPATPNPFPLALKAGLIHYYQVDDGSGSPPLIRLAKGGLGLLIFF